MDLKDARALVERVGADVICSGPHVAEWQIAAYGSDAEREARKTVVKDVAKRTESTRRVADYALSVAYCELRERAEKERDAATKATCERFGLDEIATWPAVAAYFAALKVQSTTTGIDLRLEERDAARAEIETRCGISVYAADGVLLTIRGIKW